MIPVCKPQIGQWYASRDGGAIFQVTGLDEAGRSIEIQYVDGDIDEIEESDWVVMSLESIEEPEDGPGAIDDVEREDLGYSEVTGPATAKLPP